jgi:hypothetical protein
VLWVDGHEVRPTSVEYLPPAGTDAAAPLGRHRLRGRFPADAHTLRWYYGLVIDPYPLTVRRADGRVLVEEISGDAWSRTIRCQRPVSADAGERDRRRIRASPDVLLTPLLHSACSRTRRTRRKNLYVLTFVSFVPPLCPLCLSALRY